MNDKYNKFLKRVDLVHNQVERERIKEQQAATSRSKTIQQQNAKRFADYQRVLRAELEARIFASVTSTGGEDAAASIDPDAQAFITAAAITDPTEQSAINQLVVDLKGYSIWTKFSALYPFVGGTATTHKFNLKNPLDTNAAFRLVFNGGWTHSSTGAKPNGTNGYADTFYTPSSHLTNINSNHISFYSRTNAQGGIEMGGGPVPLVDLNLRYGSGAGGSTMWNMAANANIPATSDSRYFLINSRTASNLFKYIKNGTTILTTSTGAAGTTKPNVSYYIGKRNYPDNIYSTLECAFASIGDGFDDTEAANFYTAVQAFQTTLGRSIGTQTVSDADAQAFVTAADIQDQVEANAINNLVIGLKADSLWTKMKAVYPFVGGTSTTHKYNLKDPQDTDGAFRLVFNGGWTHSSTGATPNGTNGYADTKLKVQTNISATSHAYGVYSRTNDTTGIKVWGGFDSALSLFVQNNFTSPNFISGTSSTLISYTANPTTGLLIGTRRSATDFQAYRSGVSLGTNTTNTTAVFDGNMYLGARNNTAGTDFYSNHQLAFGFLSDGLTDTDATNLNSRVTTFQTALNRNV